MRSDRFGFVLGQRQLDDGPAQLPIVRRITAYGAY
jgi:hypothetical protein